MINYNLHESYESWSRIPIDDFDYMSADELLSLLREQYGELVSLAWNKRWDIGMWRNRDHTLEAFMNLDNVKGKTVMDFGCGFGLDGVAFGLHGAQVVLADTHPKLLLVAQTTLGVAVGLAPKKLVIVRPQYPFFEYNIDLFWSFGVLHHMPYAGDILKSACKQLNPDGEIRIAVYSDKRWREMMGEEPPEVTAAHPRFMEYVRKCDTVGLYADWYDEPKLTKLVEGFGKVVECKYLCDGQMIGAVIKKG